MGADEQDPGRPGEPSGERPEPQLAPVWKAAAQALLVLAVAGCAVLGLWTAFILLLAAAASGLSGGNK
jgi:hypothetical protein